MSTSAFLGQKHFYISLPPEQIQILFAPLAVPHFIHGEGEGVSCEQFTKRNRHSFGRSVRKTTLLNLVITELSCHCRLNWRNDSDLRIRVPFLFLWSYFS